MSTDTGHPGKGQGYVAGQLSADAQRLDRRGWVIGSFFERDDPNYCTDLEVKFGQYRAGESSHHPAKISQTTEWTMILAGAVRAWVDGDEITLRAGDYILIRPGIPNNTLVEVLEDVTVLTVKAPSDPSAKTILAGTAHPVHDEGGEPVSTTTSDSGHCPECGYGTQVIEGIEKCWLPCGWEQPAWLGDSGQ